jgi:hypothetical protein
MKDGGDKFPEPESFRDWLDAIQGFTLLCPSFYRIAFKVAADRDIWIPTSFMSCFNSVTA